MTDFNALLSENTRNDQYINATKLCKRFGQRYSEFKRLPSTKAFLVEGNKKLPREGKGVINVLMYFDLN